MNPEEIVDQYKKLGLILGSKHIDVVDRLKLDYIPNCVRNKEFCHENHSKKCPPPTRVDMYQSSKIKHLLRQNRPWNMLKIIEDMCLREEFPGEEAFFAIFELILTVNEKKDALYPSVFILNQCHIVMENLLFKFPPCWYGLRSCYRNVLITPQNIEIYLSGFKSSKQNIFTFVLSMLEQTMSENTGPNDDTDDEENNHANTSVASKLLGSEITFDFHEWETKEDSKKSFDVLKRNDKLNRLFLIICILTKILELDLSVWMLRYASKNMQKHMFEDDDSSKPLIVSLFAFKLYNLITDTVKKSLRIFVDMIGYGYPPNQIHIFSRLISVLSVAINLCEQSNSHEIIYPNIGIKTKELPKAILKVIDGNFGRRIEIYLCIIKYLRIPFIKYLFIDHLLCKLNADPGEMSVEKIVSNFYKKRWLQCSESMEINDAEKAASSTTAAATPTNHKYRKYPVVCRTSLPKPKQSEIHRKEYLNLLLDALKSCCDIYTLKNVLKLFKNDETFLAELLENNNSNNVQHKKSSTKQTKIKYDLDVVEKNIENFVRELNIKQLKKLPSQETIFNFDGIYVNEEVFLKFRREIKYLMILKENVPKLKQKFGEEFNDFNEYIEEIFQN